MGYTTAPELNREKFLTDPFSDDPNDRIYKTGDLVRYQNDGNIEYIGRVDFQVKLRGLRIELGEIEYVLHQQPGILEVLVMVIDEQLVAYLVADREQLGED